MRAGQQLLEHFEALPGKIGNDVRDARDVAAGATQACDQAQRDRVADAREHDGDLPSRILGRGGGRRSDRDEYIWTQA